MPRKSSLNKSITKERKQQIIKNASDAAYHGSPCPSEEKLKMRYNDDEAQLYRETYKNLAVYIHDFPIRKAHRAAQLRSANKLDCPTREVLSKKYNHEQIEAYLASYEKSQMNRQQNACVAKKLPALPTRQHQRAKLVRHKQIGKNQAGGYEDGYQWTIDRLHTTEQNDKVSENKESFYSSDQLAHLQSMLEAPTESEAIFKNKLQTYLMMTPQWNELSHKEFDFLLKSDQQERDPLRVTPINLNSLFKI